MLCNSQQVNSIHTWGNMLYDSRYHQSNPAQSSSATLHFCSVDSMNVCGTIELLASAQSAKLLSQYSDGPVAHAVARDKVANVLLASKGRGAAGGPAHTAQDLARSIARELLSPLLDTACCRLASLLRHAFDIAADSQQLLQGDALTLPINEYAFWSFLLPCCKAPASACSHERQYNLNGYALVSNPPTQMAFSEFRQLSVECLHQASLQLVSA